MTFDLDRFVQAQASVINDVRDELRRGEKRSHWMWFVFPQLSGLGHSPMAQRYGIVSLAEAQAYNEHPVLGPRLAECTVLVNQVHGRSLEAIFGGIDATKFRSSMTLFALACPTATIFEDALAKYCSGTKDRSTLKLLGF